MIIRRGIRRHTTGFDICRSGRILVVGLDMAPRRFTAIPAYVPHSRRPASERAGTVSELVEGLYVCLKRARPESWGF